jgi:hypothetical protein
MGIPSIIAGRIYASFLLLKMLVIKLAIETAIFRISGIIKASSVGASIFNTRADSIISDCSLRKKMR